jgi:hypothetical protein
MEKILSGSSKKELPDKDTEYSIHEENILMSRMSDKNFIRSFIMDFSNSEMVIFK